MSCTTVPESQSSLESPECGRSAAEATSQTTNAVLLPMKQETIILKGTIMSAVLNIALNFALIGTFKQNGAAFTTLLAELLMCVYQYFYVRKALRIKVFRNEYLWRSHPFLPVPAFSYSTQ